MNAMFFILWTSFLYSSLSTISQLIFLCLCFLLACLIIHNYLICFIYLFVCMFNFALSFPLFSLFFFYSLCLYICKSIPSASNNTILLSKVVWNPSLFFFILCSSIVWLNFWGLLLWKVTSGVISVLDFGLCKCTSLLSVPADVTSFNVSLDLT